MSNKLNIVIIAGYEPNCFLVAITVNIVIVNYSVIFHPVIIKRISSPKRGPLFTPLPASPERESAAAVDTKVAPLFAKKIVRNKAQIKVAKPEVTRETRLYFTTKERQNFVEKVITGRSDKLTIIDYGKMMDAAAAHDDVFTVNETIENFMAHAAKLFIRYDIIKFMRKFPWLEDRGTVPEEDRFESKTINLFKQ